MDTSPSFTLAEIKKALTEHNKELNNDVKVKITKEGLKFSSAKAEEIAIQTEEEKKSLMAQSEGEKTELKKQVLSNLLKTRTMKKEADMKQSELKKQALQNLLSRKAMKEPEPKPKQQRKKPEPTPTAPPANLERFLAKK